MAHTLHLIQIVSSVVLIALILLQKSQGDMGSSLSGDNASFFQTRRGAERFMFLLTVFVGIVFVASSLAVIVL